MLHQLLNLIFEFKQNIWLLPYKIKSRIKIAKYLRENSHSICLNIGSGDELLPGWLNGELSPTEGTVYIDASKRLPFEDHTVKFINCEHLIEHLDYEVGLCFLQECNRVLNNGGVLRISTPNLEKLIQIYHGKAKISKNELLSHHRKHHNPQVQNMCEWFNDHLRLWGHKFIYDETTLIDTLTQAGFASVRNCEYGKSDYSELQGIEQHDEGVEWMKWGYVMIFEACKQVQ